MWHFGSLVVIVLRGLAALPPFVVAEPTETASVHAAAPAVIRFEPEPLCVVPVPTTVTRTAVSGLQTAAQDGPSLAEILSAWEAASARLEPMSDSVRRLMHYRYRERLSGHELAVSLQFQSPVTAAQLAEQFDWTIEQANERCVSLIGTPHADEDRLFYHQVRVELDADTALPRRVQFADRHGNWTKPVMEFDLTPLRSGPIRFADAVSKERSGGVQTASFLQSAPSGSMTASRGVPPAPLPPLETKKPEPPAGDSGSRSAFSRSVD